MADEDTIRTLCTNVGRCEEAIKGVGRSFDRFVEQQERFNRESRENMEALRDKIQRIDSEGSVAAAAALKKCEDLAVCVNNLKIHDAAEGGAETARSSIREALWNRTTGTIFATAALIEILNNFPAIMDFFRRLA